MEVLQDYDIIKLVGVGSQGEVVHARHKKTGTDVAIKLINHILQNNYSTKKVVREVQILRLFSEMGNHMYVTKIYDIIVSSTGQLTYLFIVLEYEEVDLRKLFNSIP